VRINDAIIGAVLVVFAVAEIAYTRTFPSLHGQSYGPNLFPTLIGLGLAVRGLLARRPSRFEATSPQVVKWVDFSNMAEAKHARLNAVLIILFLLLYILLSEWVGFIPLSVLTIALLLYRLGSSLLVACPIAVVTTAAIQLLFAKILLVPLPAGWLQGIIW